VTREGTSFWSCVEVVLVDEAARRGGSGRKLQEPGGRLETRVKISEMRRCWIDVSCREWC
jgi:hypothetical protein